MKINLNRSLYFLVPCLAVLIIIQGMVPGEIDWKRTFRKKDKIPFGCYGLHSLLHEVFPGTTIETSYTSYYQLLNGRQFDHTALIIITETCNPDSLEFQHLNKFVSEGNQVFVSSSGFGQLFQNHLHFTISKPYFISVLTKNDSFSTHFCNPVLNPEQGFRYRTDLNFFYFESFDTVRSVVLGMVDGKNPDYLKIKEGNGYWLINTEPQAFTNYYLVYRKKYVYPAYALSYISMDISRIIWDEYDKPGQKDSVTPLRYILGSSPLKFAYYTLITTLLLFLVFYSKRKQRMIPVIKKLPNTTVEFIETIGRLYFHNKNHRDLALKKYNFFLDFVRSNYYLDTNMETEELISKISLRSGIQEDAIRRIILSAGIIKDSKSIGNSYLHYFSKMVDGFYREKS